MQERKYGVMKYIPQCYVLTLTILVELTRTFPSSLFFEDILEGQTFVNHATEISAIYTVFVFYTHKTRLIVPRINGSELATLQFSRENMQPLASAGNLQQQLIRKNIAPKRDTK